MLSIRWISAERKSLCAALRIVFSFFFRQYPDTIEDARELIVNAEQQKSACADHHAGSKNQLDACMTDKFSERFGLSFASTFTF